MSIRPILDRARAGHPVRAVDALALSGAGDVGPLMEAAAALRDGAHGGVVSYSRKVFIPLTRLCRDVCHYCTFARAPRHAGPAFLDPEQVLDIARAGARAGCREALFTLGDRPETRYRVAREALARLGQESTVSYLAEVATRVRRETGLLPHVNPGVLSAREIARLRAASVSQGLMLESASPRLCRRGGPHYGSPDKIPRRRLQTIRRAGEAAVPFTSGILIGIGETRRERVQALLALRALHQRYGHLQEVIVQNFRAKPGTPMARAPEPCLEELLWTIAVARLVLGGEMNIQAPPNLSPSELPELVRAGINDWGGVSPVTPDHVNPEAPWPHLGALARNTARAGKQLVERLALYPVYAREPRRWLDPALRAAVLAHADAQGFARADAWSAGTGAPLPAGERALVAAAPRAPGRSLAALLERAESGAPLAQADIVALFAARGEEFAAVCAAADRLRARVNGETVAYVVNRNINYTNMCYFRCQFCAFSKGKSSENLRGRPYDLSLREVARRAREAWERGATEVCMQGGIHPRYDGSTYLELLAAVREAAPGLHVHAFSPLEVWQGAHSLGLGVGEYLARLRGAGLGSLPGTAAEILDDEVRAIICPDKIDTEQWLSVLAAAREAGLRATATIMFGHVDAPEHWARHLLRVRALQERTGVLTEFVPLPFVHMEAPLYRKGRARRGPTFREAVLMHAVARLALHPCVTNIQTSWVKMGPEGAELCLRAGANDLGGTLMNESITRAAGAQHGQEMPAARMDALIRAAGRVPRQRTTLYADAPAERRAAALCAPELAPAVQTPARRRAPGTTRPRAGHDLGCR